MPREVVNNDVCVAAVPEDIDPSDADQMAPLVAYLDVLVKRWVSQQWTDGQPIMVEFAESEWLITKRADQVRLFEPTHGCVACLAAKDQMQAFLAENPGRWVALANVTYTELWP